MSKITNEDLRMVEALYNRGFTDEEIGETIGRSRKSVGQIIHHHKDKMELIDRKWAKRVRKDHEQMTVERILQAKEKKIRRSRTVAPKPEPKPTVWDRMIGFFG